MPPRAVKGRAGHILESAATLFREKGLKAVSVDEIVQSAGVAKGTFYLYFKSKDNLLEELAVTLVQQIAEAAEEAGKVEGGAIDRFAAAVLAMQKVDRSQQYLADALNHPENTALHDRVNTALVHQVAPVLAAIVEQGKRDGVFNVEDVQSTVEFLLAGQAALLGNDRFNWTADERLARLRATFIIIERSLGAAETALVERFSAIGIG